MIIHTQSIRTDTKEKEWNKKRENSKKRKLI